MNVAPHLIQLYVRTSRRYKRLLSKLRRDTVSAYQRKIFLHELKKLVKILRGLQSRLKIASATGTLALMLNTGAAQAQTTPASTLGPFVKQNRLDNPLREPLFTGQEPALAVVDWDADGDMDVVVGERNYDSNDFGGYLRYFENLTSQDRSLYVELVGDKNPFAGIRAQTAGAAPAFADMDGDGDLDLILGQNGYTPYDAPAPGGIEYYRNDNGVFSKQTGLWDNAAGTGNPFNHIALGPYVRPAFVDFDKDGDPDLMIGSFFSQVGYPDVYIHHYENNGNGVFATKAITLDYTPSASWGSISPAFADVDNDGDFDMVIGAYYDDALLYYEQVAPATFARQLEEWDPAVQSGNPFNSIKVDANPSPAFIDFDADGNLDLFVADELGDGQNFAVYDIDYTHPQVAPRTVNVFVNSAPDISPEPVINESRFKRLINLMEITSDVDNNLDPTQFSIASTPLSGALATIAFVSPEEVNLVIDYEGVPYSGVDEMTIRACDDASACTERVLSVAVDVHSGIIVYNAIAPNSSGDNGFMRITGLPATNTVSIFNRWGDKVYAVENYQSTAAGNAFRGK